MVLQVAREVLPPMPSDGANRPLYAATTFSAIAMALLLGIAYLYMVTGSLNIAFVDDVEFLLGEERRELG